MRLWPLLALVALSGCKSRDQRSDKVTAGPPQVLDATALYADYGSLAGTERLAKYSGGVVTTGRVDRTLDLGDPDGLEVWLAAGSGGRVTLRFRDDGVAARGRHLTAGDEITVRCQVTGKPADVLFLTDCELR